MSASRLKDTIKKANIKFKSVSFKYDTGKVSAVKNIDLDIEGEKIINIANKCV